MNSDSKATDVRAAWNVEEILADVFPMFGIVDEEGEAEREE